jgi:hypothetical protein
MMRLKSSRRWAVESAIASPRLRDSRISSTADYYCLLGSGARRQRLIVVLLILSLFLIHSDVPPERRR